MGTLSIVKTTKGMRFGGYTERLWKYDGYPQKDAKDICFCLSLDLLKIYNFNDKYSYSIKCDYDKYGHGPWFYDGSVTFFEVYKANSSLFGRCNYRTKNESFGKFNTDYEITSGNNEFSVTELEVFQISFDN